jgi:hypothetical protein
LIGPTGRVFSATNAFFAIQTPLVKGTKNPGQSLRKGRGQSVSGSKSLDYLEVGSLLSRVPILSLDEIILPILGIFLGVSKQLLKASDFPH